MVKSDTAMFHHAFVCLFGDAPCKDFARFLPTFLTHVEDVSGPPPSIADPYPDIFVVRDISRIVGNEGILPGPQAMTALLLAPMLMFMRIRLAHAATIFTATCS